MASVKNFQVMRWRNKCPCRSPAVGSPSPDWSVMRIYPRLLRLIGQRENIPWFDWCRSPSVHSVSVALCKPYEPYLGPPVPPLQTLRSLIRTPMPPPHQAGVNTGLGVDSSGKASITAERLSRMWLFSTCELEDLEALAEVKSP
eukprot:1655296-Pyramimonas_sp.AAC.1